MADSLEDLLRECDGDEPFWPTLAFFRRIFQALVADRARAGANLDELPTPKGRFFNARAAAQAAPVTPNPFQLLQVDADGKPRPGENVFTFNVNSFFREDATKKDNTGITDITNEYSLADGDILYLQLDFSADGKSLDEISVVQDDAGPGGDLLTFSDSPPYVPDEGFHLLAQVFAAADDGKPARGGVVYTVDPGGDGTPPTLIEVVALTSTHLALRGALAAGRAGYMVDPPCGPLLS